MHPLSPSPPAAGRAEARERIAVLAHTQGGHVTRDQLRTLGLSDSAIGNLIDRGSLRRILRGVYAVGHIPTASQARAHAPLLAVGARSALAGWTAINALTNAARWVEPFTVMTPLRTHPQGVQVLHSQKLRRGDIHLVQGLRCVSPEIALVQIAGSLTRRRRIRLIDDLRIHHQLTHERLETAVARFPRGAGPLKRVLGDLQPEPTRSDWEAEWPAFATRFALGSYAMNVHVLTTRVDVLLEGLVVMLDGWHLHGSRHAFEHDREEMSEIMAVTGLPVLRITHRQFHQHPGVQADRILRILARRERQTRAVERF